MFILSFFGDLGYLVQLAVQFLGHFGGSSLRQQNEPRQVNTL
jgi:hypothetical protein